MGEELGGQEFQYHPGLRRGLRVRRLGEVSVEREALESGVAMTPKQMEEQKQTKLHSEQMAADAKMIEEQKNQLKTKDSSKRSLNEDDWDKSQEEKEEEEEDDDGSAKKEKKLIRRVKKQRAFKEQANNPNIIFKRKGSFMVAESTLDVGFALGDFKSTTSDF